MKFFLVNSEWLLIFCGLRIKYLEFSISEKLFSKIKITVARFRIILGLLTCYYVEVPLDVVLKYIVSTNRDNTRYIVYAVGGD